MIIAATVISAALVLITALVVVGSAVEQTQNTPPQLVFDVHEAIEFCAQALPDSVTAQLSYDELRRALRLHMEWLQAYHWTPDSIPSAPILMEADEPLEYMQERSDIIGLEVSEDQLKLIMESHYEYLIGIGALHIQPKEISEIDLSKPAQIES